MSETNSKPLAGEGAGVSGQEYVMKRTNDKDRTHKSVESILIIASKDNVRVAQNKELTLKMTGPKPAPRLSPLVEGAS